MAVKLDKLFTDKISLNVKSLTYISNNKNNIETWTDTLSELELGEAAKQIFITLLELRGLECTDLQRYQIIQKIEPNLLHLLSALEQHYLSNSLLDTKRDQQISDLVLEIKSHHALLYFDIFVRSNTAVEQNRFSFLEFNLKKKMVALRKNSAALSLKQLTNLLYSCQLLYIDVPKNLWFKAYSVYNIALHNNFSSEGLDKTLTLNSFLDTIEKNFIQLVLLSILNSHKLRPSEIKDLMQCICYWTNLITLTPQIIAQSKFVIDLDKDSAPKPLIGLQEERFQRLFIGVVDLITYIESVKLPNAHYHSKNEQRALSNVLKHHILSIITIDPTRIRPRHSEHGIVDMVLGISSAHFYLSNAKHFKETLELDIDLNVLGSTQMLSDISTNQPMFQSKMFENRFQAELTRAYQADILNRSETGFGLQWHNQLVKNLRTGEFMLIKSEKDDNWIGALIRWMKNNNEQLIEFGVEIMSRQMCPLAVKLPNTSQSSSVYHPCILSIEEQFSYRLFLPSAQVFQQDQNLILRFGQQELKIFLKNSKVLTQSCAIFDFDFLELSKKVLFDEFITHYLSNAKTQDLWESLK